MNNTPGAELAALRKTEIKTCPECGTLFTGLKRKVYCDKCVNKLKQRRYKERKAMNIQAQFNQEAIDMLPKVKSAIASAEQSERNQMYNRALREIMNSSPRLVDMSEEQIEKFDDQLIETFKFYEWLK